MDIDDTKEWLIIINDNQDFFISEPDKWIFDHMNKGLNKAKGEYIIFTNNYDEFAGLWILTKIANEIVSLNDFHDLIYGDAIDITNDGEKLYKRS